MSCWEWRIRTSEEEEKGLIIWSPSLENVTFWSQQVQEQKDMNYEYVIGGYIVTRALLLNPFNAEPVPF